MNFPLICLFFNKDLLQHSSCEIVKIWWNRKFFFEDMYKKYFSWLCSIVYTKCFPWDFVFIFSVFFVWGVANFGLLSTYSFVKHDIIKKVDVLIAILFVCKAMFSNGESTQFSHQPQKIKELNWNLRNRVFWVLTLQQKKSKSFKIKAWFYWRSIVRKGSFERIKSESLLSIFFFPKLVVAVFFEFEEKKLDKSWSRFFNYCKIKKWNLCDRWNDILFLQISYLNFSFKRVSGK